MSYIFMDESGCLGFDTSKKKTTRYFLVTFLFMNDPKPGNKIVKKIISKMKKKHKKKHCGVLHFRNEHPTTRVKVLKKINELDKVSIMSIYLDKHHFFTNKKYEKHLLYNYITNVLIDRIITQKLIPLGDIHLIAAKRETNKFLNDNFKQYISDKALEKHGINIITEIEDYHKSKNKCLQLVDAASWTIFRKLEHHDDSYYQHIDDLVIEENKLFG